MEKTTEDYCEKLCTKCNTPDKTANVYCQDCKHFLCESCLDLHKAWIGLKHQRVLKIEDLTSGKVTLSDLDQQDQNCAEHDGEQKRFYCETCDKPVCRDCIVLKQCCRDHDTVPIQQASDKHVSCLMESIKTCREKKEECQDAFEKTKLIEEALSSSAIKIQETIDIKKRLYLQAIEGIFNTYKCDINDLCKERKAKITKDTDNFKTVMNQIDTTLELGVNLTESGPPYNIDQYRSVLSRIQKVNDIEVNEVDETLADIPTPVECVLGKQWEQTGQFEVPYKFELAGLSGIAATLDGNIALCEAACDIVYVHSRSGDFKHTFTITGGLYACGGVAITPNNVYVIPKMSNCCQLYNSKYKHISEFKTCDANNQPSRAVAVTVDKDGCIILGMKDNAISIHNTDGSVKSRFAIPYQPMSVAVTSKQEIIVTNANNNTLQLLDYSGKSNLTFDPPPEDNDWVPQYVCCSKRDEVFVVNGGDPRGIYKYTAGGVYMGCITTQISDLYACYGIALSHDDKKLFVIDSYEYFQWVKIFHRP